MTAAAAVASPKVWICDLGCAPRHGTCDMTEGKTDALWDFGIRPCSIVATTDFSTFWNFHRVLASFFVSLSLVDFPPLKIVAVPFLQGRPVLEHFPSYSVHFSLDTPFFPFSYFVNSPSISFAHLLGSVLEPMLWGSGCEPECCFFFWFLSGHFAISARS